MSSKKVNLFLSIVLLGFYSLNSQVINSSTLANRQTAIRCIQVSQNYFLDEQYQEALSQAELGLAYDDSISDLWYLVSLSCKNLNIDQKKVFEYAKKSYEKDDWLIIPKEKGIIYFVSILNDKGYTEEAYRIIKSNSKYYSKETEILLSEICYKIGEVAEARKTISSAIKIYPEEAKFAYIFFKYEYYLLDLKQEFDNGANTIAQSLLLSVDKYSLLNKEILLYAAYFTNSDDAKEKMLKQYFAQNNFTVESLPIALENKIFSEEQVFLAFQTFSQLGIENSLFQKILDMITTEEIQIQFISFLSKYEGVVTFDKNNDFTSDMKVKYADGRPAEIEILSTQEDEQEFFIECDFGSPVFVQNKTDTTKIIYGRYPSVELVTLNDKTNYFINPEKLNWSIINITGKEIFKNFFFYFVSPVDKITSLDLDELFSLSYKIDTTIKNQYDEQIKISYTMSNGLPIQTNYLKNKQLYAIAYFEAGNLLYRVVDSDLDNIYETTEYYQFNTADYSKYQTEQEQKDLYMNLFGTIDTLEGLYLSRIEFDTNQDGIKDCEEQYLPNSRKNIWYDKGKVSVSYQKTISEDGTVIEISKFFNPIENVTFEITFNNLTPVSLTSEKENIIIHYDEKNEIYWLGNDSGEKYTSELRKLIPEDLEQGKIEIYQLEEFPQVRTVVVKIGSKIFAEVFNNLEDNKVENE